MDLDFYKNLDLVSEPKNQLTLLTSEEFINFAERNLLRDGKMSLKVLAEELQWQFDTFPMPLFSPLFEEFKDKIQRLVEAGLCPERLAGRVVPLKFAQSRNTDTPVMVLNIEDLGIGFLVCLVPLALSIVVFVCELAVSRISALGVKALEWVTFTYLIRAVTRIRS